MKGRNDTDCTNSTGIFVVVVVLIAISSVLRYHGSSRRSYHKKKYAIYINYRKKHSTFSVLCNRYRWGLLWQQLAHMEFTKCVETSIFLWHLTLSCPSSLSPEGASWGNLLENNMKLKASLASIYLVTCFSHLLALKVCLFPILRYFKVSRSKEEKKSSQWQDCSLISLSWIIYSIKYSRMQIRKQWCYIQIPSRKALPHPKSYRIINLIL